MVFRDGLTGVAVWSTGQPGNVTSPVSFAALTAANAGGPSRG